MDPVHQPARLGVGAVADHRIARADGVGAVGQVLEGDAVEVVVDEFIQPVPHGPGGALVRPAAGRRAFRHAGHRRQRFFRQTQDAAHRVVLRGLREPVAAVLAPLALHKARLRQRREDGEYGLIMSGSGLAG